MQLYKLKVRSRTGWISSIEVTAKITKVVRFNGKFSWLSSRLPPKSNIVITIADTNPPFSVRGKVVLRESFTVKRVEQWPSYLTAYLKKCGYVPLTKV